MGQKVNPTIFRLGIGNNSWGSNYNSANNYEVAEFSSLDVEIKKYIEKFFHSIGFRLSKIHINYKPYGIFIYVSYLSTEKTLEILTSKKDKKKIKLKKSIKLNKNYNNNIIKSKNKLLINFKTNSKKQKINLTAKPKVTNFLRIKQLKNYKIFLNLTRLKTTQKIKKNYLLYKLLKNINKLVKPNQKINLILTNINNDINLTIKQQTLKEITKKLVFLQKYKNTPFFKEGLNYMITAITKKNSSKILSDFIANTIKNNKKHNVFLKFIKKTLSILKDLNQSVVEGIIITISGRFNGAARARKKTLKIGRVSTQTINCSLNYHQTYSSNNNGSYGIKVWILEK